MVGAFASIPHGTGSAKRGPGCAGSVAGDGKVSIEVIPCFLKRSIPWQKCALLQ